jgi:hypothetical protein
MLNRLTRELRHLALLVTVAAVGIIALPGVEHGGFHGGLSVALADDDDDDGGGGGSRDRGGSGDYQSGRKPLRDFRTLFGWSPREVRRRPARRAPSIPDRAPSEIVAMGLDEASITGLAQEGFAVEDRVQIALTGRA